jgi:hypothetical protein
MVTGLLRKNGLLPENKNRVGLRLLKALYGLKQAPLLWNLKIDNFLKQQGFTRQTSDACLYKWADKDKFVLLTLSVDDILCTGNHPDKIDNLTKNLNKEFQIQIGDELKQCEVSDRVESFLGILVTGNTENGEIMLSVPSKIEKLIDEVNIAIGGGKLGTKSVLSEDAINEKKKFNASSELQNYVKEKFAHIVGSCIYMSITARPDISTWVSRAAKGMHNPQISHVRVTIELLKYLNGTKDRGLIYKCDSPCHQLIEKYKIHEKGKEIASDVHECPCIAFSDANWADISDEKLRSTSGFCIFVFGCLISWHTKRQTLTAASTMQAELIAAATCSDEVKWFSKILHENVDIFGSRSCDPIPMFVDNTAALSVSNHPSTTPKSKFVSLREFRIRDYIQDGIVSPLWIPGTLNISDGFTKLLGGNLFQQFTRLLGMSLSRSNNRENSDHIAKSNEQQCFYTMSNTVTNFYDFKYHYPNEKYFFYLAANS